MSGDALVVIDMQAALVTRHPRNEKSVLVAIGRLIDAARVGRYASVLPVDEIVHAFEHSA